MGNLVLLAIATSYLTLGIFAPGTAEALWGAYALLTFVLAGFNVVVRGRNGG